MSPTRKERAARAAELRAEGLKLIDIAAQLGMSYSYTHTLLTDPEGHKERERKRKYGRPCRGCGKRTSGGDGRKNAPRYCQQCWRKERRYEVEAGRQELIDAVREDRQRGMSRPKIAAKHGVTPSFVEYHTSDVVKTRSDRRAARERTVVVECADCGDPREITWGAVVKRKREKRGPYRCVFCIRADRGVKKDTSRAWMRPEERVDGEHGIRHWAWNVVKAMSPQERRAVAVGLEFVDEQDHSSFARPPKPRRERFRLDPHPYAKLEQPFGAKARGEMAA